MFNTRPWLYYNSYSNKYLHTYIQGILDICGNIVLRNGGFSLPEGDVSMNGNLYVGKQSTLIGDVSMNGNLYVGKQSTLIGDVSMNGNLYVGKQSTLIGDVSMNGNLYVGKQSTLIGDVSMNGNLYVGKQSTLIGDVSMNGNLYVGLDTLFNRNITVNGDTNAMTTTIATSITTINASAITYGGITLQTTLTSLQNIINNVQASIDDRTNNTTGGFFVLVCEYKGNATANAWFSFGANIATNNQTVMPQCTFVGYRIEASVDSGTSQPVTVRFYKNSAVVYTATVPGYGQLNQDLDINNPTNYVLGDTFRVRFGDPVALVGGSWRVSAIFKERV
jgi:carbonic anhydrase/acetyltransferase-like protein (isoleucine patch superfamily)